MRPPASLAPLAPVTWVAQVAQVAKVTRSARLTCVTRGARVGNHVAVRVAQGLCLLALTAPLSAQTTLQLWTGAPGESLFGSSLASLGDLDGDGRPDVAVGDPSGAGYQGQVSVFSSVTGALLFTLQGSVPGQEFGAAVAGPGDLDGDGVPDLAVGIPLDSHIGPSAGRVNLYSGAGGALIASWDGLGADTAFGAALAPMGDLDGDGLGDLAVGAPREGPDHRGGVWIRSGASGATLLHGQGQDKDDLLGSSLAAAGDVDGDGWPDLIVGAPQAGAHPGYARVLSGQDGSLLLPLSGDNPDDGFGASVAGLGDVDGDGRSELAVGVPGLDLGFAEAGGVLVFSGADGSLLHLHTGSGPWAHLGFSVAGPGDVDADGVPDVAAGTDRIEGGQAYVWRGSDGASVAVVQAFDPQAKGLGSGVTAATAGDLDGDGVADLLVGSPSRLVSLEPGRALAVRILFTPWIDLGGALAGSAGPPLLSGEGALQPGTPFMLHLGRGNPLADASLVLGVAAIKLPFKGGVLVPAPDVIHAPLSLNAAGELSFLGLLPESAEPGSSVIFQVWCVDPAGPQGWAASNALRAAVAP